MTQQRRAHIDIYERYIVCIYKKTHVVYIYGEYEHGGRREIDSYSGEKVRCMAAEYEFKRGYVK